MNTRWIGESIYAVPESSVSSSWPNMIEDKTDFSLSYERENSSHKEHETWQRRNTRNCSKNFFHTILFWNKLWQRCEKGVMRQWLPVQAKNIDDVARWTLRYLTCRYGNKGYFPSCFCVSSFSTLPWNGVSDECVTKVTTFKYAFPLKTLHQAKADLFLSLSSIEGAFFGELKLNLDG